MHAGTIPCEGGAEGDACDDGDAATTGDVCDAQLACAGVILHFQAATQYLSAEF